MQNVVWPEDFVAVFCIDNEKTPKHRVIKKKKKFTATINPPSQNFKCMLITFLIIGAFMGPERSLFGADAAGLWGNYEFKRSFLLPRYRDPCGQTHMYTNRLSRRRQQAASRTHVQTGPFNLLSYLSMSTWFVWLFIYLFIDETFLPR